MKNILSFLLVLIVVGSCTAQKSYKEAEARIEQFALDNRLDSDKRPKGGIPSDIGFKEIAFDTANHTWRDLDNYYRQVILVKYADRDFTNNLKNVCIIHLVETYKMNEKADLATVEFYINEQANFPYLVSPERFMRCLNRMKGHWDEPRIAQLVENVRQKQIKSFQEKYSNKPDVVKRKIDEYNQYLTYSKN